MTETFRRIVTGHDAAGLSVIRSVDRLRPAVTPSADVASARVWATDRFPAENDDETDGATLPVGISTVDGTVTCVLDILPGAGRMHRTWSLDIAVVLYGEVDLVLDGGAAQRLGPGDIVVQRGTSHLWRNPDPEAPCRIVFVLIGAKPLRIGERLLPEVMP